MNVEALKYPPVVWAKKKLYHCMKRSINWASFTLNRVLNAFMTWGTVPYASMNFIFWDGLSKRPC